MFPTLTQVQQKRSWVHPGLLTLQLHIPAQTMAKAGLDKEAENAYKKKVIKKLIYLKL